MDRAGFEFPIIWQRKVPDIVIDEANLVLGDVDIIKFAFHFRNAGLDCIQVSKLQILPVDEKSAESSDKQALHSFCKNRTSRQSSGFS